MPWCKFGAGFGEKDDRFGGIQLGEKEAGLAAFPAPILEQFQGGSRNAGMALVVPSRREGHTATVVDHIVDHKGDEAFFWTRTTGSRSVSLMMMQRLMPAVPPSDRRQAGD
jgi:hypothetical protein